MKLSVFVPSTPRRITTTLPTLVGELERQMGDIPEVEMLVLMDNERISIGEKMNLMSEIARGDYVSVVADDDCVVPDYVETLLDAIDKANGADVIVFDTEYYVAGVFMATIREGKDFNHGKQGNLWFRPPSDKMCWRREFRLTRPQIHSWEKHDADWNSRVQKDIESEYRIDRALYKFFYEPDKEDGSGYRSRLDMERGSWR